MKQEYLTQNENGHKFYRARILYIEDDAGLGFLLQKKLERMACVVDIACDGQEGLRIIENGEYDIVIADYELPVINGLEVLRRLKDIVPVIILTGQGDEMIAVEAMRLGAADYVAKDLNCEYMEFLPSIIDRVMERQQLIRERRQTRDELKASEARYRAIVEDQTELICRFPPGGNLTFANAAFCRFFGIQLHDLGFHSLLSLLSRKVYRNIDETLMALTEQSPAATNTHKIKTSDGKVHWLQWTIRAILDDTRKLKEYQMVGRDITDRKSVEEALQEAEEKYSALLSAITDPILRINRQGICLDLRPRKSQGLLLSAECIGKNITEIFPTGIVPLLQERVEKFFQEKTSQVFKFKIIQGETESIQEARLIYAGGNESLLILRDITASCREMTS